MIEQRVGGPRSISSTGEASINSPPSAATEHKEIKKASPSDTGKQVLATNQDNSAAKFCHSSESHSNDKAPRSMSLCECGRDSKFSHQHIKSAMDTLSSEQVSSQLGSPGPFAAYQEDRFSTGQIIDQQLGSSSVGLIYSDRQLIPLKDFGSEIRATMDVEQFVHQSELVLDELPANTIESMVDVMLDKAFANDKAPASALTEAREAIFVAGSINLASFLPPETKIPLSCNLAQLSRRHMIVGRFRQPVNVGENARSVRLFVLILTPSVEKGTKNALETGRTFATLLAQADFRQCLLEARNATEFKALMLLRAQQLSSQTSSQQGEAIKCFKNRYKYKLDPAVHLSVSTSMNSGSSDGVENSDLKGGNNNNIHSTPLDKKFAPQVAGDLASGGAKACGPIGQQLLLCSGNNKVTATTDLTIGDLRRSEKEKGSTASLPNSDTLMGAGKGRKRLFSKNPETGKLFELLTEASVCGLSGCRSQLALVFDEIEKVNPTSRGLHQFNLGANHQEATKKAAGEKSSLHGLELRFGCGLWEDLKRRLVYYTSDFKDAFVGPPKTLQKSIATVWFLYFGILLPTIAFSSLNTTQTHGYMGDLRKALIGQAIGGLGFALLGGQPLVIIMTTAPLCLYTKVIHQMCLDYGFQFPAMYSAVGLWNGFFLVIYSLFGFSELMKWCTRSTEEIFALFIVVAFISDASKELMKNFDKYYYTPACQASNSTSSTNQTFAQHWATTSDEGAQVKGYNSSLGLHISVSPVDLPEGICRRETSLLFLILMLGTLWLALTLYRFNKTPFLGGDKRELLADYALPTAVLVMSFVGSVVFDDIYVEKFPPIKDIHFERAPVELLPLSGFLIAMGLGFTLSLLFFMDQNISAAMVNAPQNRLKKGGAYHLDLLVVGILNGFLTLYGLPMMHGVLPHSPLHVRSLADIEERMDEGHLREVITNVRETRMTAVVAHILVLGSLLLIPYPIAYIPTAVLNGLFLYMAFTSLDGLQIFERILLLFTEQAKYPPNHYIRRCPQGKIHKFTALQLLQLVVMCFFGFSPFNIVEMFFPVIILLMIPFRHKIVPKFIDEKYLNSLDGKH